MADPRIEFFDNLSADWDHEEPLPETMAGRLEQIIDLLNLEPGMDLLEVGCGTGKLTDWLVKKVLPGRVVALDFSPEMIAQAQAKGIDADFRCIDVCDTSAELGLDNKFDLVFCFHCFPHLRDQALALRNFAGMLKPAGRLIVMHLAGSDHINTFHANLEGPVNGDVLPTGKAWDELLAQAKLTQKNHIDREDLFFLDAQLADSVS